MGAYECAYVAYRRQGDLLRAVRAADMSQLFATEDDTTAVPELA
jgi:hypothetical protein